MALTVCCPCGNPIACDNLDLVVTLTCPVCEQEITVEIEDARGKIGRGLLTIMEGPFWVGERFAIPVGVELRTGSATGNWLSLEADDVSPVHCRFHLSQEGVLSVADQQSASGIWLGRHRIERGTLKPTQSLTLGPFRLRYDFLTSDGTTVVASPGITAPDDQLDALPVMRAAKDTRDPLRWFSINRFIITRWFMMAYAALLGVQYFAGLRAATPPRPTWLALTWTAVVVAAVLFSGRRVALAHPWYKYISLGVLVVIAALSLVLTLPVAAIGSLFMAAGLTLLVLRLPTSFLALMGTTAGLCSVTVLLFSAWSLLARIVSPGL